MADMTRASSTRAVSWWAAGFASFAGAVMIMVGCFHAIAGLVAIFDDNFYVVTQNYTFDLNVTGWGWIHLILGIVIAFAGYGIFKGAVWARATGIILAGLSAIANFFFIPYYPFWSLLIIALDITIIWALTVWDRSEARASGM